MALCGCVEVRIGSPGSRDTGRCMVVVSECIGLRSNCCHLVHAQVPSGSHGALPLKSKLQGEGVPRL